MRAFCLAAFLFSAGFLLAFGGAELACRFSPFCSYRQFSILRGPDCKIQDPGLGLPLTTNCVERQVASVGGQIIGDSLVTRGPNGFRVSPGGIRPDSKFLTAFFGCSVMEGGNVGDEQTLPYYFSRAVPSTSVANFGVSGFGPQQAYLLLSEPKLLGAMATENKRVVGVYGFGDWQLSRVGGNTTVACGWGQNFPRFVHDLSGKLERSGTLGDRCPAPRLFFPLLNRSALWQKTIRTFPLVAENGDSVGLAADLIAQAKAAFGRNFSSADFFVLLYPGYDPENLSKIKRALAEKGVRYLDYSALPGYRVGTDGHPTAETQALLARELAKDLRDIFTRRPRLSRR